MRLPKASQVVPASKLDTANGDGATEDSRQGSYKVDANAKSVGRGGQAGSGKGGIVEGTPNGAMTAGGQWQADDDNTQHRNAGRGHPANPKRDSQNADAKGKSGGAGKQTRRLTGMVRQTQGKSHTRWTRMQNQLVVAGKLIVGREV